MTMPVNLFLVRHGEADHNLATKKARNGDTSYFTPEFRARHTSAHRLTPKGRQQADAAGDWLRRNGFARFDRRYVSSYVRAIETAGLLGLDGPGWMIEPNLREREWGDLDGMVWEEREALLRDKLIGRETDPLYWMPPNGESIVQVTLRLRAIFDTLHRECFDKNVLVVCHGETEWTLRLMLERMTAERWMELHRSRKPEDRIFNCDILHYTRRDPDTGELSGYLDWVRLVRPTASPPIDFGWQQITRPKFSNEELLAAAQAVPPLFEEMETTGA